jgi:sterol desaturase/sphingolipid hydroxylase (fatty acid hydroxylase superfamily)
VWLGFAPQVVLSALTINLLYQFWLHTTWIPKLGWLEYVLNTPSTHRVHHASNDRYLDANFGGVLIVFDRLFGTYVEERAEEPCVYGTVHPIRTHNLLALEFWEWRALWRDLRNARSLGDAIGHVLRPPGWTPAAGEEPSTGFSRT